MKSSARYLKSIEAGGLKQGQLIGDNEQIIWLDFFLKKITFFFQSYVP